MKLKKQTEMYGRNSNCETKSHANTIIRREREREERKLNKRKESKY